MKKVVFGLLTLLIGLFTISFQTTLHFDDDLDIDSLRKVYAKNPKFWPKPTIDSGVNYQELSSLPNIPLDLKNDSILRIVELGEKLFFETRLSGSNKISCGTCHNPQLNYTDGFTVSIGHDNLKHTRNTPSLENVWYFNKLFWDGRAANLKEQAMGPISASNEMNQDLNTLSDKISNLKAYKKLFKSAFGKSKISNDLIFESLATFQKTISSGQSPFDLYLNGNKNALTDQQITGLHLFRTKARCLNCHNGPFLTNNEFHNLGLTNFGDEKYEDLGLYLSTFKIEDIGKFKTPGLRNVMKTAPYFHNGLTEDIDEVLEQYNMGMHTPMIPDQFKNDPRAPQKDKLIHGIRLSNRERQALKSFLTALNSESN